MSGSNDDLTLIHGLRSLEERSIPGAVRRDVARKLESTLFAAASPSRVRPLYRWKLAPLSLAFVIVGTSGALWASINVVRTVFLAKAPLEDLQPRVKQAEQVNVKKVAQGRTEGASPPVEKPAEPAAISNETAPSSAQLEPQQATSKSPVRSFPERRDTATAIENAPAQIKPAVASLGSVAAFEVPPNSVPTDSSLQAERSLIDSARSAIRAGNSPFAERALSEHANRYPQGRHTEEREALRVFSAALRSRDAARQAAHTFHNRYPNSLFWRGIANELQIQ